MYPSHLFKTVLLLVLLLSACSFHHRAVRHRAIRRWAIGHGGAIGKSSFSRAMISPELTSLAVNGNQSDLLLLEAIATSKKETEKQIAANKEATEKQIAANKEATEKQIAASKEATEKQIAANKEATEKQIAATEKQIAASKEATEKQIAATDKKIEADIKVTREITREVIMAANARFENILLQIKQDK